MFQVTPGEIYNAHLQQLQIFELTYFGDIKETIDISHATEIKSITFEHGSVPMEGRAVTEPSCKEELIKTLMKRLENIKEQITRPVSDNLWDISNSIDDVWTAMNDQTHESALETMEKIKDDKIMLDTFLSFVPYVGTDELVKLVFVLVSSDEIKDSHKMKILDIFPRYINEKTSEVLKTFFEILIKTDFKNKLVRNSAILSFPTMLSEMYQSNTITEAIYLDYVKKYSEFFKDKSYEHKMLYLLGLQNLQSDIDTMISTMEEHRVPENLRILAASYIVHNLEGDWKKAKDIFMPILKNETLSLEFRVVALDALLESNFPVPEFAEIYEYLKEEAGDMYHRHLYHYLYSSLASYAVDTKCHTDLAKISKEYLPKLKEPTDEYSWLTGNFRVGFTNSGPDYGSMIHLKMVGNPVTNYLDVFDITFDSFALGLQRKYRLHLKFQGAFDAKLQAYFKKRRTDIKHVSDFIKIIQKNGLKLETHPMHMEIILYADDRAVFATHLDKDAFSSKNYVTYLLEIFNAIVGFESITTIRYPVMDHLHIPSDLGTDLTLSLVEETIAYQSNKNLLSIFSLENVEYFYETRRYGEVTKSFSVYNPVSNVQTGLHVIAARNMFAGIKFNLTTSEEGKIFVQFQTPNLIHNTNMQLLRQTYITDEDILHEHCPSCGVEHEFGYDKKKKNIDEMNFPMLGYNMKIKTNVSGGEDDFTVRDLLSTTFRRNNGNYEVFPLSVIYFTGIQFYYQAIYTPQWSTYEYEMIQEMAFDEPTMTTIGFHPEYKDIENTDGAVPGSDTSFDISVEVNKIEDDSILRHKKLTLNMHEAPGLLNKTLNLDFEYMYNAKYYKVCMNVDMQYPPLDPDYYSLKAAEPTKCKVYINHGLYDQPNGSCSDDYLISLGLDGVFTLLDDQKELATKAEAFPFKECKAESAGLKYTAPTRSCELASEEMSRYRKYDLKAIVKPNTSSIIRNNENYLGNFMPTLLDISDIAYNVSLQFGTSSGKLMLLQGEEKQLAEAWAPLHTYPYIDKDMLLTSKDFVTELGDDTLDLGFCSTCVVTNQFVQTFAGNVIEKYEHVADTEMVALIECEKAREGVLFTNREDKHLEMNMWMDQMTIIAKPKADGTGLEVLVNDDLLGTDKWITTNKTKIYYMADDVLYVEGSLMKVYFNMEYIRIETYSLYNNKICGICSPQENAIHVKH